MAIWKAVKTQYVSIEGAFSVFDVNEDGLVDYPELVKGFEALKIPITKQDV